MSMSSTNTNTNRRNNNNNNNQRDTFPKRPNNNNNNNNNNGRQSVAIIGGGISGLSCAQELVLGNNSNNNKYDVTVYDTGRLRPGGRCASRQPGDPMKPPEQENQNNNNNDDDFPLLSQYRYDHAAQFIAAPGKENEAFAKQLEQWKSSGILKEFPQGSVCSIDKNGKVAPIQDQTFYYGTNGMGNVPLAMVDQAKQSSNFALEQDTWVSPSSGVKYQKNSGTWKLQAKGKTLGYYDKLVIAHNGKCADRIMSKTPSKEVHSLLRVNFSPNVPAHGGNKMTLNSLYSVTVVLPLESEWSKTLPPNFVCGMLADHPQVRSLTCQTRKYNDQQQEMEQQHEVWTIISSATFGKKHKAPQEFLPQEVIDKVTALLVQAVDGVLKTSVGGTPETPNNGSDKKGDDAPKETTNKMDTNKAASQVLEHRVQLWGAAVPLNVWKNEEGFLYDSNNNVGVVGDWLVEPSIGGAWTSGYQLAQHLNNNHQSLESTEHKIIVGLEGGSFERSESVKSAGIAAIPQ
ncbi:unnamed protein product [Cylindrotheca closterium]|uniref:Amine oxidase domain-containing protein n=1 Tax=Cylindrotheca closterium TaxID=2856 RepID=A0AAD2FXH1_9STRA|nr:unnamed protein product [Cylindrotheca closterium]